ncbi:MAG: hypothetical protein M1828_003672 [Chrysothrix sp. TS-e1954]|nr:MAG: hypothetical protein M1828_003672 [Chrysothrix sp. TS-e1954]
MVPGSVAQAQAVGRLGRCRSHNLSTTLSANTLLFTTLQVDLTRSQIITLPSLFSNITTIAMLSMMAGPSRTLQLLALLALAATTTAHSWVDQLAVIGNNGSFVGQYGYPRGYVQRSAALDGHSNMYLLPPASTPGRVRVDDTDMLCHPAQRTRNNQTQGLPRLSVAPGSAVAMKYLENGHVTLLNVPGKPYPGSGTVFVFGTDKPSEVEKLTDVMKWNKDQTGGNKNGRLLAANNFDDGRCSQVNPTCPRAVSRLAANPNPPPNSPPGTPSEELSCETNVILPTDLKAGNTFTLYWVWEWPTLVGTPGEPNGKDEYYITCIDVDVKAQAPSGVPTNTLSQQDPMTVAVSNYKSRTATTPEPVLYNEAGSATFGSAPPGSTNGMSCPAENAPATAMSAFPGASFPSGVPAPAATPAPAAPAPATAAPTSAAPAAPATSAAQPAPVSSLVPQSAAKPAATSNAPMNVVVPHNQPAGGAAQEHPANGAAHLEAVSRLTITGYATSGASIFTHQAGDLATMAVAPAPKPAAKSAISSNAKLMPAPTPKAAAEGEDEAAPPHAPPPSADKQRTVTKTELITDTVTSTDVVKETVTQSASPAQAKAADDTTPLADTPVTVTVDSTTTRTTTTTTTPHPKTAIPTVSAKNLTLQSRASSASPHLQDYTNLASVDHVTMDDDCTHTAEPASSPAAATLARRYAAPYARRHARDVRARV